MKIHHMSITGLVGVVLFQLAACALHAQFTSVDPKYLSNPLEHVREYPQFLAGPRIGFNRNFHTGGFRSLDGIRCPTFGAGSGWGMLGGITAEFPFDRVSSLVPAVSFESRPGLFTQRLPDLQTLVNDVGVTESVSMHSSVAYRLVSAEVMYKYDLPVNLGFLRISAAAGPAVSYVVGGTMTQTLDLETPENARFLPQPGAVLEGGGRRLVFMKNAVIPQHSRLRAALRAGLQLELGLFGNRVVMYPGIFYDIGFTPVTETENWNLNSTIFQVDFRRAF